MRLNHIAAAAAALVVAALGACAVPGETLGSLDRDNDSYISRAEAQGTSLEDRFPALDTDNDGRISLSPESARSGSVAARAATGGVGSTAGTGASAGTGTAGAGASAGTAAAGSGPGSGSGSGSGSK